jgi:hypothetical protein
MFDALYFNNRLHHRSGCAALGSGVQRPHPGLTGDFDLVADMMAELCGAAYKVMDRVCVVNERVLTRRMVQASFNRSQVGRFAARFALILRWQTNNRDQ